MNRFNFPALVLISVALSACSPDDDDEENLPEPDPGLEVLGGNTHSADNVEITDLFGSDDLETPMDLAFHPTESDQLWIVSQGGPHMTIISDASTDDWSSKNESDATSAHFMVKPAGLAFGTDDRLATIHEEDETTPYTGDAPGTFMGPTLWTSVADDFDGGHGSHYDMLHNSPNGVGIAWEADNIYWIFDGYYESLTRYDFADDHGAGGSSHSDAEVLRYASGEVSYEEGVVSQLVFDAESELLYIADAGNSRVAVLDTTSGDVGDRVNPNYDGSTQNEMDDADIWTLIDSDSGLEQPAGLAIYDGLIYVVDHATSFVWAFDLDGEVVDWLETGIEANSLQGIEFDSEGRIVLADSQENRVLRISDLAE